MKVLVATDGTRSANAATRFAAAVAGASRGGLLVVTVGDLPTRIFRRRPRLAHILESSLSERERLRVEEILKTARREGRRAGARVRSRYARARELAPTAETISREADREHADLIVVGSAGGSALSRWVLGSIAHRLVHTARRPVAVVRSWKTRKVRTWRILVATDGSPAARKAERFAGALAARVASPRLTVLTVSTLAADLALTGEGIVRALGKLPDLERAERKAATRILAGARRAIGKASSRAVFRARQPKSPMPAAQVIVREAEASRADMIVIGRTGSSLVEIMLGSVAQQILTLARCPVVLVRGRG